MGFHFFKPNEEELALIKEDWEELMEMVSLGQVQQITARYGTIIQMRPKAADNKDPSPRFLYAPCFYPKTNR